MPMYAYKGVASSGKTTSGVRDAESPKVLRQALRKDGILVTSFELSRGGKLAKEVNAKKGGLSRDVDLGGLVGGVRKVEIAAFTRQMATLIKAKVQGAMIYPLVMGIVGGIIMAVLLIIEIPKITEMFKQQGKTLPINTR